MINYIFIGGCGHSGTTLLVKILILHSEILHYYKNVDNEENKTYIFNKYNEEYQKIIKEKKIKKNKVFLLKNPSNILHIDDIRKLYKRSKIILMYRDGRDVALSCYRRKMYKSFKKCVRYWKGRSELILEYKNDKDIYLLKYEDIMQKKGECLKEIINFLKLPDEDLIKKYNNNIEPEKYKKPKSEKRGRHHRALRNWQINQPLYDSSVWRKELTWWKKRIFYKEAGEIFIKLGYKTE